MTVKIHFLKQASQFDQRRFSAHVHHATAELFFDPVTRGLIFRTPDEEDRRAGPLLKGAADFNETFRRPVLGPPARTRDEGHSRRRLRPRRFRKRHGKFRLPNLAAEITDHVKDFVHGVTVFIFRSGDRGIEQARAFAGERRSDAFSTARDARDERALEQSLEIEDQVVFLTAQVADKRRRLFEKIAAGKRNHAIHIGETLHEIDIRSLRDPVDRRVQLPLEMTDRRQGMEQIAQRAELDDKNPRR